MKKHLKKILSFGVALSIVLTTIINSFATENISINLVETPKIDIILTSKDTDLDLSNFETDVKAELQSKGINTNNINFQTVERNYVESEDADFAQMVNTWDKEGAPVWRANGNTIICNITGGQPSWNSGSAPYTPVTDYTKNWKNMNMSYTSWWTAGLVNPTAYESEKLNATFTFERNGNLRNGFMFNVTKNANGTYNGYMFDITNHVGYWETKTSKIGVWVYDAGNNNGYGTYRLALWRFENIDLDKSFSCSNGFWCWPHTASQYTVGAVTTTQTPNERYTTLATWTMPRTPNVNSTYNVIYDKNNIKITLDDVVVANVTDSTYKYGSYGFWTNNCERVDSMTISKFSVISDKVKTFKEVLTEPTWREDAKHIVVNVDNNTDNTLTSTSTIGEILSRTLADDIHFIQWGTDTNKSATTNFIRQNDNKGLFTYNNNYEQALKDTVEYIKSLVNQQESEEQIITIGQEINLLVTPEKYKINAISDDYPNGRWKINHNYKYFANNLGQSADAGIYSSSLKCNFDKPGKYEITFDDEIVKTVYVHRKPVADFEIEIENLQVTLNSASYDLDSNIDYGYGKGIASEKWYYKKASASEWTEGKLMKMNDSDIYVIKLEVTDNEGVTSYTTKYVGVGNPVSKFTFTNDTVCKYNKLEINNTSYDPEGRNIKSESWTLKKNNQVIGTYSEPILNFNTENLGTGNYSYTLIITNNANIASEAYTKSFTIVDDIAKPEIIIETETTNEWLPEKDIDIEISDNESAVSKWRYEFVTSPTPTIEDTDWSNWDIEKTEMTINSGALSGRYYLHIQAYDSANNLTERTIGPFNLDNTNPVINGVDVEKQGFRDNKVTIHAFDEHSGIVGYALTKYEPTTFDMRARTFATVETPEFQESNEFKVDSDGLYTAWAIDALGNIETSVCEVTNSNQTDKTTTVYAEIGSEFKVTIPKKIVLDGTTKSGTYQVTVEGDIAGLEVINVTPDSAVTLSSKDKADVIGTITQDKLNWTYSEIYTDSKILANGSISASGITAGAWNGTFNFAIKLENNGKYTDSEWYVEYQDITFDMEELDNFENENIE